MEVTIKDASGREELSISSLEIAIDNESTDDSSLIQGLIDSVAANGGGIVDIPSQTYIAKNIVQGANIILRFAPKTILKFPIDSINTDRMIIVGSLDGNFLPSDGSVDYYGIQGNGLIIDASNIPKGNNCNGIFVSGAINFQIDNVIGVNISLGYTVEVIRSYGTRIVYPMHGIITNIKSFGTRCWGAIACESCIDLLVENIYCEQGTGIVLESDIDVMPNGIMAFQDIVINKVISLNGSAVTLNPKRCYADTISISNISASFGGINLYYNTDAPSGSIKNVFITNFIGDGGGITENGFESPNDVYVDNLIVTNATAQNYNSNGFRCNAGTWYNCIAKLNGLNGWNSTFQTPTAYIATFFSCVSQDNNVRNGINYSGFSLLNHAKLEFDSCIATDTRTTKLQWYGVFASYEPVYTKDCMFDGNKIGRMGPKDRAIYDVIDYETFMEDINHVITPYKKITTTIGIRQTTLPHNLNRIPSMVIIVPKRNATVWESAVGTNYNIFLTASVNVICDVYIY
ncbi:hypothetical protein [Clostridium sp.]|uniref:hypothetical protein n=1 Tax=Clostridium sp. TaxID=1506 RepID=UPI0026134469|nr:hypothetical protein [uncultured Clostridium sp.]